MRNTPEYAKDSLRSFQRKISSEAFAPVESSVASFASFIFFFEDGAFIVYEVVPLRAPQVMHLKFNASAVFNPVFVYTLNRRLGLVGSSFKGTSLWGGKGCGHR